MKEAMVEIQLTQVHLLVVGDVWLERHLAGNAGAADGEVPVLRDARRRERPGGAGHVALCAAAMGCKVVLCGLWGDDGEREELARSFEAAGVETTGLVTGVRATASETTFAAGAKRLLRMDVGGGLVGLEDAARLEERAVELVTKVHAVVFADAGKGVLSGDDCVGELSAAVLRAAHGAGVPVVAKAAGSDLSRYSGSAAVWVRAGQLAAMTGQDEEDEAGVTAAAWAQMEEHEVGYLLTPAAGAGMRVLGGGLESIVAGGGDEDAVLAGLAAALAEKMPMPQAVEAAMRAAEGAGLGSAGTL